MEGELGYVAWYGDGDVAEVVARSAVSQTILHPCGSREDAVGNRRRGFRNEDVA